MVIINLKFMIRFILIFLLFTSIFCSAQDDNVGSFKISKADSTEKCVKIYGTVGASIFINRGNQSITMIVDSRDTSLMSLELESKQILQDLIDSILYSDSTICKVYNELLKERIQKIVIKYKKQSINFLTVLTDTVLVSSEAEFEKMYAVNRFPSSQTWYDVTKVNSLYLKDIASKIAKLSNSFIASIAATNPNYFPYIEIVLSRNAKCEACK